jgi:hypothetical protein
MSEPRTAYAAAGVDVEAGDRAVELMRSAVERTRRPEVLGGLGGFGAAVSIPAGFRDPVLVSSTDGVGTKTAIAAALGRYDTIGQDLVAMCADDVVCSGAAPLFFLDYVAVGRLDPEQVADLVGGVAAGCVDAGCALVGGETAEHPGLMQPGDFDLAGFCVGVVERDDWLDGGAVRAGDAIIGLPAELYQAAELDGASFRHPVTVIFRSLLDGLLCGDAGVCAVIATVANPTIPVNTPVQILFFMLPPDLFGLQRSDRKCSRSSVMRDERAAPHRGTSVHTAEPSGSTALRIPSVADHRCAHVAHRAFDHVSTVYGARRSPRLARRTSVQLQREIA